MSEEGEDRGLGGGEAGEENWLDDDEELEAARAKATSSAGRRSRKPGLRRREDDDDEEEDSNDEGAQDNNFNTGGPNGARSDQSSNGGGGGAADDASPQPSGDVHDATIDERRLDMAIASIRGNHTSSGSGSSKSTSSLLHTRDDASTTPARPAGVAQRKPASKASKKDSAHQHAVNRAGAASGLSSRGAATPAGSNSQSASSSSASSPKKRAPRAKRAATPSSSSASRKRATRKSSVAPSPTPSSSSRRRSKANAKHNESAQMLILRGTELGETDYGDRKIWQTHPEERINVRDMVTQVVRGGTCAPLAKNLQRWLLKNKTWWIAEPPGAKRSSKKSKRSKINYQVLLANLVDMSATSLGSDMAAVAEQIKTHAERGEKALTKHDYTTSNVQFRKALNALRQLQQAATSPAPPTPESGPPAASAAQGGGTSGASSD